MSTATLTDDTPLDPDDELLVAYLDGELDRQQRSELEDRLLEEAELRTRLQQLQTGWDLLEELPNPSPNTQLVETTLELAVADLVKPQQASRSWWGPLRWPLGVAAASLAGVLLVLLASVVQERIEYRAQLRDLALAESLDAYRFGSDLQLMRQLMASPQWDRMVTASRELRFTAAQADESGSGNMDGFADSALTIAQVPVDQRAAAIKAMPIDQRTRLYSRWERFSRLDPASQQQIRRTAEIVRLQPDREDLLTTMQAYAIWREMLPDETVDAIEQSAGADRRKAIDQAIDNTMVAISEQAGRQLSPGTIDRIYVALQEIMSQRISRLEEPVRREYEQWKEDQWKEDQRNEGGEPKHVEHRVLSLLFDRNPWWIRRRLPLFRERLEPLQPDELETIRWMLSDADLESLDNKYTGGDPLLEAMMLRTWAEAAVRRKFPWPRHNEASPLEIYQQLPPQKRDEIDLLPPEELMRHLTRESYR